MDSNLNILSLFHRPSIESEGYLPEGLLYCELSNRLYWLNIQTKRDSLAGEICFIDLATNKIHRQNLPVRPAYAALTSNPDWLIIWAEQTLGFLKVLGNEFREICRLENVSSGTIANDGYACEHGVFVATKNPDFNTADACLFHFDYETWTPMLILDDFVCGNGIKLLERNSQLQLLFTDSKRKQIVCYPYDSIKRYIDTRSADILINVEAESYFPDGNFLLGKTGNLLVAYYNPSEAPNYGIVRKHSLLDGAVVQEWRTSLAPQATSPCLMRYRGQTHLVVATAIQGNSRLYKKRPNLGCLFYAPIEEEILPAYRVRFPL